MSDIFISYSSKDRDKAKDIAEALKQQGYSSVWWDRSILPGETFDAVIEEALDAANCVIVLWSKTSVSSDWVKAEASEGKQRRILIPVLIDDVKIPLAFRRIQAADLRDWEGKLPHPGFGNLLKAVAGILGRPRAVQPGREIKADEAAKTRREEEERLRREQEKRERRAREEAEEREREEQERFLREEVERKERERKAREETENRKREEQERPKTFTNSIDMKFSLIPAGKFYMGSEERDVEKPRHKVKINNAFYLGTYPVTQRKWKAVMGDHHSYFEGEDLPVERVSWDDVQEFIKKLNEKESTNKYRLPSEAEWEYACRAGTTTRYSFGDDESKLGDYGRYAKKSEDKTHPVGQKKANPWGLYDMHGNVWEWVQDEWHDSYDGAPADGSAWESGDGAGRVLRGGGSRQLRPRRPRQRPRFSPSSGTVTTFCFTTLLLPCHITRALPEGGACEAAQPKMQRCRSPPQGGRAKFAVIMRLSHNCFWHQKFRFFDFKALFAFLFLPILNCWIASYFEKIQVQRCLKQIKNN